MEKAAATWNFQVLEKKLYLCVNGNRMVGDDGEYLVVEQIGHGRSGLEIWIKFQNAKVGKNLLMTSFKATAPFTSEEKISGSTVYVTDLISAIVKSCPWISVYRRKRANDNSAAQRSNKKKKTEKVLIEEDDTNVDMGNLHSVVFKEQFIGQFEVNVLTLSEPPEAYMARTINQEWVTLLKEKILKQPHLVSTILPVLVDPSQVKDKEEFQLQKLSCYTLWTIGGNHIRSALQQIANKSALNDMRNVNIRLYCGLTMEDAISLGNIHNGTQVSLKPTFQDSVKQAMKYKDEEQLSEKVVQMLKDIELREVPKESVGTICSVVRYSEENYKLVHLIFKKHEQKSGSFKSIPQTMFREMQGIKDSKRLFYLEHALQHGLDEAVKLLKRDKKRAKLEKCFMQIVNLNDMEMCRRIFPEYVDGIDKYIDLEMPGNCIPEVFVEFCHEAANSGDTVSLDFSPLIDLSVRLENKDISNLESVKKITNKVLKNLLNSLIKNEIKIINELQSVNQTKSVDDSSLDSSEVASVSCHDSGFCESFDSSENNDEVSDSNMETQPPAHVEVADINIVTCIQSQDLF